MEFGICLCIYHNPILTNIFLIWPLLRKESNKLISFIHVIHCKDFYHIVIITYTVLFNHEQQIFPERLPNKHSSVTGLVCTKVDSR